MRTQSVTKTLMHTHTHTVSHKDTHAHSVSHKDTHAVTQSQRQSCTHSHNILMHTVHLNLLLNMKHVTGWLQAPFPLILNSSRKTSVKETVTWSQWTVKLQAYFESTFFVKTLAETCSSTTRLASVDTPSTQHPSVCSPVRTQHGDCSLSHTQRYSHCSRWWQNFYPQAFGSLRSLRHNRPRNSSLSARA